METIDQVLAAARAEIERLTPREALDATGQGAVLVDMRPVEQRRRDGLVPGARVVDRNVLEWRLDPASEHRIPDLARRDHQVILICDEGYQSSLAAATLCRFGLDAADVIGGVQLWREEGLPLGQLGKAPPERDRSQLAAHEVALRSRVLQSPDSGAGGTGL
ncbi:MAG TPA: rhodanese-like domain-containing protein [Solirubrobacterales bacterium]|nr:rhodanese-like domain-containing protein [Solirubrobacterales bacterium]